jgi:hypothetical protein
MPLQKDGPHESVVQGISTALSLLFYGAVYTSKWIELPELRGIFLFFIRGCC